MNLKKRLVTTLQNARKWISLHKGEFLVLTIILAIAAICRLYKIDQYMTFLGDEGRDVILVRRFLKYGDIMLIGPGTSIGNMYLGPFYYYFIAPALLFAGYSPVGPAVLIALLGVVTVWLVWYVTREWFGRASGLIAALLYAIAPTVIVYSRSSWNPNIMPFFALICIYGIWRVWKYKELLWLPIIGISFAVCLQSHYLGLLLAPVLGMFWILVFKTQLGAKKLRRRFFLYSFLMALTFIVLMSPLVIFDARHEWRNFGAIETFFTERQSTVSIRPWNAIPQLWPQLTKVSTRLIGGYDVRIGQWVAVGILALVGLSVSKRNFFLKPLGREALLLICVWLAVALGGLALYKQEIYDHYYGFFFPVPFILVGALLGTLIDRYKIRGAWLAGTGLVLIVWGNLVANPLLFAPNKQLHRSVEVTRFIREQSAGQQFNFAVIAERNYEGAYRYFFDQAGDPVRDIDPQNTKDTITDQLFVVCEMEKEKCNPTNNAKAEVANFGWSKIEQEWTVFGTTIFKLTHSLDSK